MTERLPPPPRRTGLGDVLELRRLAETGGGPPPDLLEAEGVAIGVVVTLEFPEVPPLVRRGVIGLEGDSEPDMTPGGTELFIVFTQPPDPGL